MLICTGVDSVDSNGVNVTFDAWRRTSTTTLTGNPGVISFMASIHHLYACETGRNPETSQSYTTPYWKADFIIEIKGAIKAKKTYTSS